MWWFPLPDRLTVTAALSVSNFGRNRYPQPQTGTEKASTFPLTTYI